jgi:hypothetical protein
MALGNFTEAVNSVNKVLELDTKNEDASIIHALIFMKNENYQAA